jgi:hypothetical protein
MGTVMSRLHHARKRLREVLGPGFALIVAALVGLLLAAPAVRAQAPPLPPPGILPPPTATPGLQPQQVCVYALVVYASNPPGGVQRPGPPTPRPPGMPRPGLPTTPDLDNPATQTRHPPTELQSGCGQPIRLQLWVPRLREVFQYSQYEPVSAIETRMPVGMLQRFALPGGREMEIQPLAVRRPIVRILVRVKRGQVGEIATVMDVPPRRPALIGGLPHQSGVLIIAIRSREE